MAQPDFSVSLVRPDDLLVLTVEGVNLTLGAGNDGPALVRMDPASEAYLVVVFPPQSFAERAYLEDTSEGNEPPELPRSRPGPPPRRAWPSVCRRDRTSRSPSRGCSTGTRWSPSWCRPHWDRPPLCRRLRSWPRQGRPTSSISGRRGHRRQRSSCPTGSCCRQIRAVAGCPPPRRGPAPVAGSSSGMPGWAPEQLSLAAPSTRVPARRCVPSGHRTTPHRVPRCRPAQRSSPGVVRASARTGGTRSSG